MTTLSQFAIDLSIVHDYAQRRDFHLTGMNPWRWVKPYTVSEDDSEITIAIHEIRLAVMNNTYTIELYENNTTQVIQAEQLALL